LAFRILGKFHSFNKRGIEEYSIFDTIEAYQSTFIIFGKFHSSNKRGIEEYSIFNTVEAYQLTFRRLGRIEEYSFFDTVRAYHSMFRRLRKFQISDKRGIEEYSIIAFIYMMTPLSLNSDHMDKLFLSISSHLSSRSPLMNGHISSAEYSLTCTLTNNLFPNVMSLRSMIFIGFQSQMHHHNPMVLSNRH
jgi:hypothetical protein